MNKQQLANKIWESANKMRSKIEANEYKDYILGFIFYKFLSDREEKYLRSEGWDNEYMQIYLREEYDPELFDEDYSEKDHRDFIVTTQKSLGYFMSYDHLFSTWLNKGSDFNVSDVRDALSAFSRLINSTHKKVFEGVFDTLQTGLSKLGDSSNSQTRAISDLIHLIKDIPMDGKQDYDVLGFIYEYLISNFAANAGKKAGEFYTPHEVSLLMSEIVANHLKDRVAIKIYDPTSGSGSLLINIGKSIARYMGNSDMIKYYVFFPTTLSPEMRIRLKMTGLTLTIKTRKVLMSRCMLMQLFPIRPTRRTGTRPTRKMTRVILATVLRQKARQTTLFCCMTFTTFCQTAL